MKSYKEIEKKYSPKELAESYVFPNELNSSERQESLEFFKHGERKMNLTGQVKAGLLVNFCKIINKHRAPNEKFIVRLEIHSNKNFPALFWFKLIEKEKAYHLLNNRQLRITESKFVKSKLDFTL